MMQRLITADKRPSERFEFWQEVVCKKYVSASAATSVDECEFDGRLLTRPVDQLTVSEFQAPLHFWSRRSEHIRRDGQDAYIASLIREGEGELTQFGRSAHVSTGDLVIYETGAPFDYALRANTYLIKIPKTLFDAHLERPQELMARRLERGHPLTSALSDLIARSLYLNLDNSESALASRQLSKSTIALLTSICDLTRNPNPGKTNMTPLVRVMQFARAHLDDERLTPEKLAEAGSMSVRSLNRLFGTFGETPMRWLWMQRLKASQASLSEGRSKSVTEAAFTHGFKDLAHFSRSYKRAFGATPRESLKG